MSNKIQNMKKEELLKRLEELNTVPILKKDDCDEYRQILNELEQIGVPPLSLNLEKDSDRQTLLSSLDNNVIPIKTFKILKNNNIETVGDLPPNNLSINYLPTMQMSVISKSPSLCSRLMSLKTSVNRCWP